MVKRTLRNILTRSLSPPVHVLLALALSALLSPCSLNPPPFDETGGRSQVRSVDPALVYAPHFKDDRFFNPWMHQEDKGLFILLRWWLTASQEYTEAEKTYLPRVLDNAKERILAMPKSDYALLPTTAFHPRWFMHSIHMNVEEAIEAFNDLNARYMIPQQWGTFHLGDEPPGYSILELRRKIAEGRLDASRFIILDIGKILSIAQ